MKNHSKKILKLSALILTLLIVCVSFFAYYVLLFPNVKVNKRIYIKNGTSHSCILNEISQDKILKNNWSFGIVYLFLCSRAKIYKGSYLLKKGMNNWQAICMIKNGLQEPIKFTFSTAIDKYDFASQVVKKLNIDEGELIDLFNDNEFLLHLGFDTENILSLFIPNTYYIYWTISGKEFFTRMYLEYKTFWKSERLTKANNLKLSPIQVYILASIVQSETNKLDEASKIAGVYINRLRRGIPLYSCPTIKFILNNAEVKRITNRDTQIKSPYNTYKNKGLPPGPICMPSISYIDAVLNYEEHSFLFFSCKEDLSGYHYFAKTLKEHTNNARNYRNKLNSRKIYR